MNIRDWIAPACRASFPSFTGEQSDAYEGASAYLDWLDTLKTIQQGTVVSCEKTTPQE